MNAHRLESAIRGLTLQVLEREKEIEGLTLQVATQEGIIETLVNNDQFMPAARELLRVCVDAHRMFNEITSANGPYPYLNMTSVVQDSYEIARELEAAMRGAKNVGV